MGFQCKRNIWFLNNEKWIGNYNDDEDNKEESDKGIDMPDGYFDV